MSKMKTGPVRIGDDWAGLFLCGDYAIPMALTVTLAAREMEKVDPISAAMLRGLAHTLGSCREPCNPVSLERTKEVSEEGKDKVSSASDDRVSNNTVRHQYRPLTADEKSAMLAVKDAGLALIDAIEKLEPSRERSLAVTKAEEAVMWAIKGLTK